MSRTALRGTGPPRLRRPIPTGALRSRDRRHPTTRSSRCSTPRRGRRRVGELKRAAPLPTFHCPASASAPCSSGSQAPPTAPSRARPCGPCFREIMSACLALSRARLSSRTPVPRRRSGHLAGKTRSACRRSTSAASLGEVFRAVGRAPSNGVVPVEEASLDMMKAGRPTRAAVPINQFR